MPRKELQAILLLSRMMITVENALWIEIAYKRIWTDSMTAIISWLRGQSKSFRSFVACRVGEITYDFDPITDIAYVPSGQNVIDLVSRGVDVSQLQKVTCIYNSCRHIRRSQYHMYRQLMSSHPSFAMSLGFTVTCRPYIKIVMNLGYWILILSVHLLLVRVTRECR